MRAHGAVFICYMEFYINSYIVRYTNINVLIWTLRKKKENLK